MSPDETLARVLLAIALALIIGRILASGLARFRQPPVLGEIVAGIVLGPTVLGAIPGASSVLFPGAVRQALSTVGGVGLVVFMFVVGLQLDLPALSNRGRSVAALSIGAVLLPFASGLALAALLYGPHHVVDGHTVPRVAFALFLATALSLTAFPVLARILRDWGLNHTEAAQLATASAAFQDVAGWILLALALAAASAPGAANFLRLVCETAVLGAIMLALVRPLIRRFDELPVILAGLVACAGAAQLIGLHSVVGAFFFGLVVSRNDRPRACQVATAIIPLTAAALLPIYFLTPGLAVNLRSLTGQDLAQLALIVLCACAGKLLGAFLPARATGLSWRDAGVVAVLLNTRGLIEIVVLNVGRTEGILDPALFTILVAMAVITTLMTGPMLHWIHSQGGAVSAVAGATASAPSNG